MAVFAVSVRLVWQPEMSASLADPAARQYPTPKLDRDPLRSAALAHSHTQGKTPKDDQESSYASPLRA